jgi:hypothetical protein
MDSEACASTTGFYLLVIASRSQFPTMDFGDNISANSVPARVHTYKYSPLTLKRQVGRTDSQSTTDHKPRWTIKLQDLHYYWTWVWNSPSVWKLHSVGSSLIRTWMSLWIFWMHNRLFWKGLPTQNVDHQCAKSIECHYGWKKGCVRQ